MSSYRFFYTNALSLVSGYSDSFDVEAKTFKLAFDEYKTFLNGFGGKYVSCGYYRCNETIRLMSKKYLSQIHTVSFMRFYFGRR